MTIKQKLFIQKYLTTGNGTQAVLAVYKVKDANVASSIAYENLRKPDIQNDIKTYFEREGLGVPSVLKTIKNVMDNGSPVDRLNASIFCLKLMGVR